MITILDENDNRPVFTRTSYRADVTENSKAGGTFVFVDSQFCTVKLRGESKALTVLQTLFHHNMCHYKRCSAQNIWMCSMLNLNLLIGKTYFV